MKDLIAFITGFVIGVVISGVDITIYHNLSSLEAEDSINLEDIR